VLFSDFTHSLQLKHRHIYTHTQSCISGHFPGKCGLSGCPLTFGLNLFKIKTQKRTKLVILSLTPSHRAFLRHMHQCQIYINGPSASTTLLNCNSQLSQVCMCTMYRHRN